MAKVFTREMYDELVEVLNSEAVVVFDAQDPEQVGARSSVNHPWQVETSELSPDGSRITIRFQCDQHELEVRVLAKHFVRGPSRLPRLRRLLRRRQLNTHPNTSQLSDAVFFISIRLQEEIYERWPEDMPTSLIL